MTPRRHRDPPVPRRQVEALEAYLVDGSVKGAARRLGISESRTKNLLHEARLRTGRTTEQLIYLGARDGWLGFPAKAP